MLVGGITEVEKDTVGLIRLGIGENIMVKGRAIFGTPQQPAARASRWELMLSNEQKVNLTLASRHQGRETVAGVEGKPMAVGIRIRDAKTGVG